MKKTTALLLVLVVILSLAACGKSTGDVDPNAKSEDAMTWAEYNAAADDDPVIIEAFIQGKRVYSAEYGNTCLYLADGDGAYFVYRLACTADEYAKFVDGQKIRIEGYKASWAGEVEVADATFKLLEGNWIADVLPADSLLGTDGLIDHQNAFVSFNSLTVAPSTDADGNEAAFLYNWDGSGQDGDDIYFNVSLNGQTYTFTVETDQTPADSDVYAAVKALNVGDTIEVQGFLYWYEGPQTHVTYVGVK